MPDMLSRIFNETYLDHLTLWFMTSGARIILIAIGAFLVLRLLYVLIARIENVILKEGGEFTSSLETEKRLKTIGNLLRKVALCGTGT